MTASQLAQLFTNLGNPLPYDRLSAIMQEYDVSKSGQVLTSWAPNKLHKDTVQCRHHRPCLISEHLRPWRPRVKDLQYRQQLACKPRWRLQGG